LAKRLKTIVLFDIDGTLLVSFGAGRRAFDRAFKELFQVSSAWGNTIPHGRTDWDLIEEIALRTLQRKLSNNELGQLEASYIEYFAEEIAAPDVLEIKPGVPKLLQALAGFENILLGIETGNLEKAAELKLRHAKLDAHFSFGGFGSDSRIRKEIIETAISRGMQTHSTTLEQIKNIVVVGDAPQDVEAAKAVGARAIAVATGRSSKEELNQLGADLVFDTLEETEKVINAITAEKLTL